MQGKSVPIIKQDSLHSESRYRLVLTFGDETIRRFPENTAAMQKLAARDYEDMLDVSTRSILLAYNGYTHDFCSQCSISPFEGLFPGKHNDIVLSLLFTMCTWHCLAKLRMHTDSSLETLEDETKRLGRQARRFKKTTCEEFTARELPKEIAARGRREAARIAKGKRPTTKAEKIKLKKFNINTPKFHILGHYVRKIRWFGTTDSCSTQIVSDLFFFTLCGVSSYFLKGEMQHKRVKRLYAMTNKRNAAKDVSKLEAQQRKVKSLYSKLNKDHEDLPQTAPEAHYHMAQSRKNWIHLPSWLNENEGDPALTVSCFRVSCQLRDTSLTRLNEHHRISNKNFAPTSLLVSSAGLKTTNSLRTKSMDLRSGMIDFTGSMYCESTTRLTIFAEQPTESTQVLILMSFFFLVIQRPTILTAMLVLSVSFMLILLSLARDILLWDSRESMSFGSGIFKST